MDKTTQFLLACTNKICFIKPRPPCSASFLLRPFLAWPFTVMSARKEKEKKKEGGKEGNKSKNHRLRHAVTCGGGDTQTDDVHMNRKRNTTQRASKSPRNLKRNKRVLEIKACLHLRKHVRIRSNIWSGNHSQYVPCYTTQKTRVHPNLARETITFFTRFSSSPSPICLAICIRNRAVERRKSNIFSFSKTCMCVGCYYSNFGFLS